MKVALPSKKSEKNRVAIYGSAIVFAWIYRMISLYVPLEWRDNVAYVTAALSAAGITFINGEDIAAVIAQGASVGMGTVATLDSVHSVSQMLVDPIITTGQDDAVKRKLVNSMIGYDDTAVMNAGIQASIKERSLNSPETVDASLWDTNLTRVINTQPVQSSLPKKVRATIY